MTDDNTIKVEGTAEVQEKRVDAGVDGDRIEHETLDPGEAQELEDKKRRLVEAYMAGRAAAPGATPAKDKKANQGSVIAIVAVAVVFVLALVGFAILMWRISKSEAATREFVLEKM
ncbi:MAG: hypothetical protein M0R37_12570 [Bacteroidales bacterium]|nr:hypothetical protein [Bacteroidales bacterium]